MLYTIRGLLCTSCPLFFALQVAVDVAKHRIVFGIPAAACNFPGSYTFADFALPITEQPGHDFFHFLLLLVALLRWRGCQRRRWLELLAKYGGNGALPRMHELISRPRADPLILHWLDRQLALVSLVQLPLPQFLQSVIDLLLQVLVHYFPLGDIGSCLLSSLFCGRSTARQKLILVRARLRLCGH